MRPPRGILAASYLAFALAGMFFMFWRPTLPLQALLGSVGFIAWNLFLIAGGLIGAGGAWTRRFRIEIIAAPFLWAGLTVYGVTTLWRIPQSPVPGVLAGLGTIFVGAGLLFLGKGLAIYLNKIRVADHVERRADDGR